MSRQKLSFLDLFAIIVGQQKIIVHAQNKNYELELKLNLQFPRSTWKCYGKGLSDLIKKNICGLFWASSKKLNAFSVEFKVSVQIVRIWYIKNQNVFFALLGYVNMNGRRIMKCRWTWIKRSRRFCCI